MQEHHVTSIRRNYGSSQVRSERTARRPIVGSNKETRWMGTVPLQQLGGDRFEFCLSKMRCLSVSMWRKHFDELGFRLLKPPMRMTRWSSSIRASGSTWCSLTFGHPVFSMVSLWLSEYEPSSR